MRKCKAYMTVEAAFVVPTVIFVFAALIYFSNYLYTRCVLAQDCYILAFRASSCTDASFGDDPGGYVMSKCSKVAGNKYYGSDKPSFRAVVRGKEVEVSASTEVRHSALNGVFTALRSGWRIDVTQKAKKREYAKHIRTIKRIKDIGLKG